MNANELVTEFSEELENIARRTRYSHISCIELTVGTGYGVSADELEMCFEDFFDNPNAPAEISFLTDAVVKVTIVEVGDEFPAPNRSDTQIATGWEMLITNVLGH